MTTLSMSLLTFPVVKNSVWESVFGVPFERGLRYHRALGAACWLFVTAHAACWWIKWKAAGILWPNVVATGTPDLLYISMGASNNAPHTHHNNPTIPIAELAWLVLTVVLTVAAVRRRVAYEWFQFTHLGVLFFVIAAEVHAWSHWYHSIGEREGRSLARQPASRSVTCAHHSGRRRAMQED